MYRTKLAEPEGMSDRAEMDFDLLDGVDLMFHTLEIGSRHPRKAGLGTGPRSITDISPSDLPQALQRRKCTPFFGGLRTQA